MDHVYVVMNIHGVEVDILGHGQIMTICRRKIILEMHG
jgi:hypothetical protein